MHYAFELQVKHPVLQAIVQLFGDPAQAAQDELLHGEQFNPASS